ncbi:amidohydrolase family protein [Lewinella sp. W8]|uniref:amidohydrolase family protein n=1 Tax=Lewinella sp. W8 TaxID=2528208 RepID=UPI0010678101|nr:amidohydrolase family protein [Lewinella sp. W8]MTB53703.1 amidohydrolase family protein [Lewinella sp. W8]
MTKLALSWSSLLLLLLLPLVGFSQNSADDRPPVTGAYFIQNALVVTQPGAEPTMSNVLIRDGLLAGIGKNITAPADAKVMKGDSLYVYAGFIDGLSHVGVPKPKDDDRPRYEGYPGTAPNDVAGIQPDRSVMEMIKASDKSVEEMRKLGFTTAHVVPHGNMLPGQGAIIQLGGDVANDMVIRKGTSLFAQFVGGRRVYPATDMAIMSKFRELYKQAEQAKTHAARYAKNPRGMARPETDAVLTAFDASIDKKRPIFFAVDNVKEMHRAMTLQKELGFPLVLANVSDGFRAMDMLKSSGTPLFLSMELPEDKAGKKKKDDEKEEDPVKAKMEERRMAAMKDYVGQAAMMAKAGVPFGFSSMEVKAKDVRGNLERMIGAGLTADQALAALTTTPAKMLGLSDMLGTVEKGKIANLVISDKPYFEKGANVRYVFVDGMPHEYEVKKKKTKKAGDANATAKAAGSWSVEIDAPGQDGDVEMTITGEPGDFSGSLSFGGESTSLSAIELDGNTLTFEAKIDAGGQSLPLSFEVVIDGDSFDGSVTAGSFGTFDVEGSRKDPE